jgi:hypothetical protein
MRQYHAVVMQMAIDSVLDSGGLLNEPAIHPVEGAKLLMLLIRDVDTL